MFVSVFLVSRNGLSLAGRVVSNDLVNLEASLLMEIDIYRLFFDVAESVYS